MSSFIDHTGDRLDFAVVLKLRRRLPTDTSSKWYCLCDCGRRFVATGTGIRSGATSHCGCRRGAKHRIHAHSLARTKTPTYNTWSNMIQRCTNPSNDNYPQYGGRGIKICRRWRESFEAFLEDMGERPDGLTLDRIDNDLGYRKSNCRWATDTAQMNNRRCVTAANFVTYKGRTQPVSLWSKETGISANVLRARIRNEWTVKRMMTTPVTSK